MAYGTPGVARRDRAVLHRHPPRPAADARAARRPRRAATTPSAASPRWPSAPRPSGPRSQRGARRAARPGRFEVVLGQKHADAEDRGRASPTLADAGRRRASSAWCWPRTTRRSRSASTSSAPAAAAARARRRRPSASSSWHLEPAYLDFLAGAVRRRLADAARPTRRCCSPPTRLPERVLAAGDPYPDAAAGHGGRGRRARPGCDRGPAGRSRWQSAGRTPEPWLGPRHPRGHRRPRPPPGAPTACSCAPAGSSPTTSRCSTTSTSRPAGVADGVGPGLRPHAVRQRRPGRAWPRWPTSSSPGGRGR